MIGQLVKSTNTPMAHCSSRSVTHDVGASRTWREKCPLTLPGECYVTLHGEVSLHVLGVCVQKFWLGVSLKKRVNATVHVHPDPAKLFRGDWRGHFGIKPRTACACKHGCVERTERTRGHVSAESCFVDDFLISLETWCHLEPGLYLLKFISYPRKYEK